MQKLEFNEQHVYSGNLVLVNRRNPIQHKQTEAMVPIQGTHSDIVMAQRPSTLLSQLIKDCSAQDQIVPVSGYRSLEEQEELFNCSLRDNGREFTLQYVAVPNCSEHQTGLAIDLAEKHDDIDFIRPHFPYTGICAQFRRRAADYGFVERYSAGKETVTGIAHEPWHFRFIGYPHSTIMQETGYALEEYIDHLRNYQFLRNPLVFRDKGKSIQLGFFSLLDGPVALEVKSELCQVSGNNVDGVIVTLWQ